MYPVPAGSRVPRPASPNTMVWEQQLACHVQATLVAEAHLFACLQGHSAALWQHSAPVSLLSTPLSLWPDNECYVCPIP